MKGISKIVGQFRGPLEIVGTDSHNGIDVNVDGELKHFNVSQTAEAFTHTPQDRAPPAYESSSIREGVGPKLGINIPVIPKAEDSQNPVALAEGRIGSLSPITRRKRRDPNAKTYLCNLKTLLREM